MEKLRPRSKGSVWAGSVPSPAARWSGLCVHLHPAPAPAQPLLVSEEASGALRVPERQTRTARVTPSLGWAARVPERLPDPCSRRRREIQHLRDPEGAECQEHDHRRARQPAQLGAGLHVVSLRAAAPPSLQAPPITKPRPGPAHHPAAAPSKTAAATPWPRPLWHSVTADVATPPCGHAPPPRGPALGCRWPPWSPGTAESPQPPASAWPPAAARLPQSVPLRQPGIFLNLQITSCHSAFQTRPCTGGLGTPAARVRPCAWCCRRAFAPVLSWVSSGQLQTLSPRL